MSEGQFNGVEATEVETSRILRSEPVLNHLGSLGTLKQYAKNTVLLQKGEVPTSCYLVIKGEVVGYEEVPNGAERIYFILNENALLLEANVLMEEPSPVRFKTSMPSELLAISRERLFEALGSDAVLRNEVIRSLSTKFLGAMDEVRELKSKNATWRLCKLLLTFAHHYGADYDGKILIQRKLSLDLLTSMLGVNRATTVRGMHQLRDMGLIENINGYTCIRSLEALERHKDFLATL